MKLYWINSEDRYVAKKSDIPKGEPVDKVDIPTDTQGLMDLLNHLHRNIAHAPEPAASESAPEPVAQREEAPQRSAPPSDTATLAERITDASNSELGAAVEAAVCRIGELGKEGKAIIDGFVGSYSTMGAGLGAAFYRGVAILTLTAAFKKKG